MFRHRFYGFQTVSAFRNDFNFVVRTEQFAQHLPSQFFVIYDDGAQFCRLSLAHVDSPDFRAAISTGTTSSGAYSAGNNIITRNLSSSDSARKGASVPY